VEEEIFYIVSFLCFKIVFGFRRNGYS
jgi:hypothetical protein